MAIGGIISGIGTSIGGMIHQDELNRAAAQRSRHWQESMSNTAYQRSMADLKKAGINPLYVVSKGMKGATTGAGGGYTAGKPDYAGGMQKGAHTALLVNSAKKEGALARQANAQAAIDEARVKKMGTSEPYKTAVLREKQATYDKLKQDATTAYKGSEGYFEKILKEKGEKAYKWLEKRLPYSKQSIDSKRKRKAKQKRATEAWIKAVRKNKGRKKKTLVRKGSYGQTRFRR